jgi:hypothetical protein
MSSRGILLWITVLSLSLDLGCGKPPSHSEILGTPSLDKKATELKSTLFTAYLDHEIVPGQNLIWCATMQLAWNELSDLCGGEIHLQGGDPPIVTELNRKIVTRSDMDDSAYVAMVGSIGQGIMKQIRRALDSKFGGQASPELLGNLPPQGIVAYSYLFKNLAFAEHFLS